LLGLAAEVRERCPGKRLVLQIIGGNPDQVEQRILAHADLVLGCDEEETVVLKKLNAVFTASATR
jgi:hypothetical protein